MSGSGTAEPFWSSDPAESARIVDQIAEEVGLSGAIRQCLALDDPVFTGFVCPGILTNQMDIAVTIDRVSPVPLYHQLARQLKESIASGDIAKGAFLDNEIELAKSWQVSRPTVRRAIQDLVDDGLLVRRRGVGTQVVNDQVRRPFTLSSLFDDLAESGITPITRVITLGRAKPPRDVADALELPKRTEAIHLVRLRSVKSRPLAILANWLVADLVGEFDADELEERGMYDLLRERGIRPHYAVQRVGARAADADEAELLRLSVGDPLVTMRRVMQDDGGRPVEVGDHVYDAAHYSVEMSVVDS